MHELGPEPNFNESMYINLFDHEQSLGGPGSETVSMRDTPR